MAYPSFVKLVEVGARDGLQNEPTSLSVPERVAFIDSLSKTGLRVIEVGAFVSPKWVPQMADSGSVYQQIQKQETVSYPALVPNQEGLEKALAVGVREIAVFTASSETFCQKNINCSIEESFTRFQPVVEQAHSKGVVVRGYVSCVMGCPYEGEVPFHQTERVAKQLLKMGCYEISLGDTIGVGTPEKVRSLLELLLKDINVSQLAVHFHDTYGQALANILQSLQMGIQTIDASVAGLGGCPYAKGASGNVATEDVLYLLNGLRVETGVDLPALARIGNDICARLGKETRSKTGLALKGIGAI